jgi:anti-sigma factor RsiW
MTDTVHEHELHAYVDDALTAARRLEVEAWLASHPDDAARVEAWARYNHALHAAFNGVLSEPLPLDLVRATRRRAMPAAFVAMAAMLAMLITGLVGYAIGVGARQTPAPLHFAQDAALAHAVFTVEGRHPVEVDAAHSEHLVAWLSKRVGTQLHAPDFSKQGFALLGGRLLSDDAGPVAQFMYQDGVERRVTLYVRRAAADKKVTTFRHVNDKGVDVFYWVDRDFGYALSGEIGQQAMQQLAEAAYHELLRAPARQ